MNKQQYANRKKRTGGGRGGKGMIIIGCIRERETGRAQLGILPDAKTGAVQNFVIPT